MKKDKTAMSSLYEQLGGENAVDAAVDLFYRKVLADDRIKHFFDAVDMQRQARHQKMFLTYAFGGAPDYPGKAMRAVHSRLVEEMGLSDEHFDAVMENLGSALKDLGVADNLIAEAAAIAESTRDDVLNR
jgi:hemoglobin